MAFFWTKFLSDEAHFKLGGYINKHNHCIWDSENLQVIEERSLHPEKVTVWYALWSNGVIGPYFFESNDETTVTVNSEHYSHMITNFLPAIEEYDVENMCFQHDGGICHTARANMALLKETFSYSLISLRDDINWPPRSWDLTWLWLFLCGYAKDRFYADN